MDTDQMTTLQSLLARQEISALLYDYCRALDAMDMNLLRSVFTEDCVVDYGPEAGMRTVGRDRLVEGLEPLMRRWTRTSHHLSNVQIWLGDGEARSISYVMAWHEFPDRSSTTLLAQYHDRHVRRHERWQVAERRLVMAGSDLNWDVPNHRLRRLTSSPSELVD